MKKKIFATVCAAALLVVGGLEAGRKRDDFGLVKSGGSPIPGRKGKEPKGLTPLMRQCWKGSLSGVQVLLGGDSPQVNATGGDLQRTALTWLAVRAAAGKVPDPNAAAIAELLLQHKAQIAIQDIEKKTAADYIAGKDLPKLLALLNQ